MPLSSLECQLCGIKFTPNRIGEIRKYCSYECAMIFRNPLCKLNNCIQCGIITRNPMFCSHSCSTIVHNSARSKKVIISKSKKIKSIRKFYGNDSWKNFIVGPYIIIYKNICAKTGIIFYSKSYQKYHPSTSTERQYYASLCKFRFSISQFPSWFNNELIIKYGWYSTPGSKKGIKNLNGVSRDHRISIEYGWLTNIDPKLISHPANCQLIPHKENQHKNVKSSITLEELLNEIQYFGILYIWPGSQELHLLRH